MAQLLWNDEFSVGVQELDRQHQRLLGFINTLNRTDKISAEELHSLIYEMSTYAREHLDYEESLLEEYGYPDTLSHSKSHDVFMDSLSEYSLEMIEDYEGLLAELKLFLTDWWQHHVLEEDMKFKSFFEEKGVK